MNTTIKTEIDSSEVDENQSTKTAVGFRVQPIINYAFAKKNGVLIHQLLDEQAEIWHRPEITSQIILELRRMLGCKLVLTEMDVESFNKKLTEQYQNQNHDAQVMADSIGDTLDFAQLSLHLPQSEDLLEHQDDAPIIRLINTLFTQAIKRHASDIHIETFEQRVVIRFRIDGILQEVLTLQRALAPMVISRIKVMAKLDIAEKRLPQDGRISLQIAGHTVDVRVSTLPASHSERIVLRLLDKSVAKLDLSILGMSDDTLALTKKILQIPNGIILVTGPTGSGKSTTLYAMLNQLNDVSRNILTVEDPIEYELPGIGQTQVNTKVDLTFAKGLRAILRQDPDVVMVGEIRDLETARIAIQASLTGHLVLSTLHTNHAIGAIMRLCDMGSEPYLLSSSLIAVIGQRLVRVLCSHCKKPYSADATERQLLGIQEKGLTLFQPQGCEQCQQTGYHGRTGIYEFVLIDETLQRKIHLQEAEQLLAEYAYQQHATMRQDGFNKVLQGKTTLAEILRVTAED